MARLLRMARTGLASKPASLQRQRDQFVESRRHAAQDESLEDRQIVPEKA